MSSYRYHPVSLGERILRAETAPVALLAIIMYEKEL
ncbi:16S rRNA (uracil(1498)-N(3))-methyltransferase [Spiroplasma endosymbiont of Polydrusus cervinus]